jgi:tRNA-splicing endonuclease subunit Sen34
MPSEVGPTLPIPISQIGPNYMIFSPTHLSYLRRTHHIIGVLTGTIPQAPQQNVFLGLPLQVLPEETRLLVEKGVAYIVDEKNAHEDGLKALREEDKRAWLEGLETEIKELGKVKEDKRNEKREKVLAKEAMKRAARTPNPVKPADTSGSSDPEDTEPSLFSPQARPVSPTSSLAPSEPSSVLSASASPPAITPQTSYPPLALPTPGTTHPQPLPPAPPSYPLYAHLHALNYFISPGLRFGCTYLVYPGDPLRFHSHFLTISKAWDEEFDVMEIVGGGRLGTGVKKGFLVGGEVVGDEKVEEGEDGKDGEGTEKGGVRCFSVEWAAM